MIKFKALRENVTEALKNPYKGKPERDLKRKLASFETQLADLIKKSRFRQRKDIEDEIRDMETKVQQVRAALKEDVNEAKYNDNDLVHIAKANVRGNNNPKTDKIIGYSKAPKNPNKFPNPKSGANAIMRIGDAKKKGFRVESVNIEEAFSTFAVPIPSQTLNGKKIGGGKTPIIVKARTAREAIQKAAKQLGVDFKFLKTGKVVKEDVQEAVELDENQVMSAQFKVGDMPNSDLNVAIEKLKDAKKKAEAQRPKLSDPVLIKSLEDVIKEIDKTIKGAEKVQATASKAIAKVAPSIKRTFELINRKKYLVASTEVEGDTIEEAMGGFPQVGSKFALKKKHVKMIQDIIKSKGNAAANHIQMKMGYSKSAAQDLIDLAQGRAIYGKKLGMTGSGVVESLSEQLGLQE